MRGLTLDELARDRDLKAWAVQDLLEQAVELANRDRPELREMAKELDTILAKYDQGIYTKEHCFSQILVLFRSHLSRGDVSSNVSRKNISRENISETTYCPDCITFGQDCSPDPEEYRDPCVFFKRREEE